MKKFIAPFLILCLAVSFVACSKNSTNQSNKNADIIISEKNNTETTENKASSGKALVVYFSWSGNTKAIANEIASQTGADVFEIVPETPYTTDYDQVVDDAKKEQQENARPKFKGEIKDFDKYDVVHFGFPNWWRDMPMIMYTFLDTYDLSGKTIAPFVSSGGNGFSDTISSIEKLEPNAKITDGLELSSSESQNSKDSVEKWLSEIGLAK